MSLDGIAYLEWRIDARIANGQSAIQCSYPYRESSKKTAPLEQLKTADADNASMMSDSTASSKTGLLDRLKRQKGKK